MKPIKIPVFYYKAKQHIPHTFIFEEKDTHIWGLPELEYPGLAKVFYEKINIFSIVLKKYFCLCFLELRLRVTVSNKRSHHLF